MNADHDISAKAPGEPGREQALRGLLVVELGARIGAAVCGSLLAQLGATVVTVEAESNLPGSDKLACRQQLAAGKLSLSPDQAGDEHLTAVAHAVGQADVVITSSDLDRAFLRELVPHRPDVIVCDVSAFGATGPLSGRPALDGEIQALTGMADATGLPDSPPIATTLPVCEYLAGMHAAGAVLVALRVRSATGRGQAIDIALYDAGFAAMSSFLTRLYRPEDAARVGKRMGNRHTLSVPWNVYEARDGWLLICTGSDVQWRRLCEMMGRPELASDARCLTSADRVAHVDLVDGEVQSWTARHSVAECVEKLGAASIPSGPIAPIENYTREANLDHRGMIGTVLDGSSGSTFFVPGSPLRMSMTPGRAPTHVPSRGADLRAVLEQRSSGRTMAPSTTPRPGSAAPLAGIRVIEIGHYTTAPVAARFFGALGAEVIKVEPPEGEAARGWPPIYNGQSLFYTLNNSDKLSVKIDLNTPEGCAALHSLIETADVLIENLKPGALARKGFSPADLARINPRLVYCGISGFGADSLYAGRPAFDTVVQGMSGLMDTVRWEGVPLKTGISTADVMGAAMSFLAVVAALVWRDSSGLGQAIDMSMQDVVAWATKPAWNGGKTLLRSTAVACRDGYVLSFGADDGLDTRSDLSRDEYARRHAAGSARVVPVLTAGEMMRADQTGARELDLRVHDERGEWPALATTLRLLETSPRISGPAPPLGRDNDRILGALDVAGRDARRQSRPGRARAAEPATS